MVWKWNRAEEDRVASLIDLCVRITTRQLKQIHAHVVANGQSQNNFVATKLVRTFAELGNLEHARAIVNNMNFPNGFVWNALIRGFSIHPGPQNTCSQEAFILYEQMHRFYPEVKPLPFTFSSVLKACAKLTMHCEGRQIHAHSFKLGFELDVCVQTTLIELYGKCGHLNNACQVFDEMSVGDVLDTQACNMMVELHAEAGDMESAKNLFDEMPEHNVHTYVAMIDGYAASSRMNLARDLLDKCFVLNSKNSVVFTAMISGYARSGNILAARQMFDELDDKDVATWNAMITSYTHVGLTEEALALFCLMLEDNSGRRNAQPNHTTIAIVASACAQSGSPNQACLLQAYVDCRGTELLNNHTITALIDMHSKCGDLRRAYDLFLGWKHKDLVGYSAMIAGFGIHGCGENGIKLFEELQEANLKPDAICFVSLLAACSHSGMVKEGKHYFELMKTKYHIIPMAEHYMCLVDLLGRAGRVEEAYRIVTEGMPPEMRPHAGVWGSLLSACRTYSNVKIGEVAAKRLIEIEPKNAANYVLLSNIYAKVQRWSEVMSVRVMMRRKELRKQPGWSWVEMEGGRARKFMTGEVSDSELEEMLLVLSWELKDQGYLPSMDESEE